MVQAGMCVPFLLHQVDGTVREVMLDGHITEEIEGKILEEDKTYDKLAGEFARASKAYRKTQDESQYPLRGVAFCANVRECDIFAGVAAKYGVRCRVVTGREAKGKGGQPVIAEAERALVAGEFDLIVTVKKLAEGWDCKPVNAAIWARACNSAADVVQGIGRTGRSYYDEIFGKKTVSHIFETRWAPKSSDGRPASSRGFRLLGIEGALALNGEDPRLVCSNSDYSQPAVVKPRPLQIVSLILDECLRQKDFGAVFSAVSYFSAVTEKQLGEVRPPTLYYFIKRQLEMWRIRRKNTSSFENTIVKKGYTRLAQGIQTIKEQLFDLLGEEILKRGINHELALAAVYCEPSLSTQAFEKLKQQNPSHAILANLAGSSSEHSIDCWYLLTQQLPPAKYLVHVLKASPKLELRAWNELKKRDLITKDLAVDIALKMKKRNPTIGLEAQRCLLDRTIDNEDLRRIIDTTDSSELSLEAARILLEQTPTPSDLWDILGRYESLKEEALTALVSGRNAFLIRIIKQYEKPWRLKAAVTILSDKESSEEELLAIINHVPEMKEQAARRLMARRLNGHILAELVLVLSLESLRAEAADRLLKKKIFCNQARARMVEIIVKYPELRDRTARALLDDPRPIREKNVLRAIIEHMETHRAEAGERFREHTLTSMDRDVLKKFFDSFEEEKR